MEARRVMKLGNGFRRWDVGIALALVGVAAFTHEGVSQTPEGDAGLVDRPVVVEEWTGRWSGPFESDGPMGFLTLTISHNGEEWVVVSELADAGAPPGGQVRGWGVRGDRFDYLQWFDDIELAVRGRLVEGELVGEMVACREGEEIGLATFRLRRTALPSASADDS